MLEELDIINIPIISTEQSAALCAPALSCIHSIYTPCLDKTLRYARTVPYLTELRRLYTRGPIDHVLLPLFAQYCLKLDEVKFRDGSNATPTHLLQLVENCRHLRTICFSNMMVLTDEILINVAQHCPNLQVLYLETSNKIHISDASLLALSEHCPHLKSLDFHKCTKLTETAALHLIQYCKQLHTLILPYKVVSEETVLRLPVTELRQHSGLILYFGRKL